MRAAMYGRTGSAADVLFVGDVPRPDPQAGEVRVRVHVSAVNPTDSKSRLGLVAPRPSAPFQIPGQDGAGVIDAVGGGVPASRIGERVWVWMAAAGRPWGTAAEWTVVPHEQAVRLPEGASLDLGACLGIPAMTAHRCLFADGPLDGKTVLVTGGAGAVGHYAIQLARRGGATVLTTVSGSAKGERAQAAGADVVVNYHDPDMVKQLKAAAPDGVHRVVEVALGANFETSTTAAAPNSVISTYAHAGPDPELPFRRFMDKNLTLQFVVIYGAPRSYLVSAAADITAAVETGALTELPTRRYRLSEAVSAHEAVESRTDAKILIDLA